MRFIWLILIQISLFGNELDCIVIGSSPFSLLEALYQCNSGKNVLILEEAPECGGAWKGIDICGLQHVDMGCHQIGHNLILKDFLEEYVGCNIVSLDHPHLSFDLAQGPNGWYFAKGCYELIDHLLRLIDSARIPIHNHERVDIVTIDSKNQTAIVQTSKAVYQTKKVIATPMSFFKIYPCSHPQNYRKGKHSHLYMLIQDPTPFRFTYTGGITAGTSRMMNLTYFTGLAGTGRQLIVIQTHNDQYFNHAQTFLEALKQKGLVDPSAYILEVQNYVYESGSFHQGIISQLNAQDIIEVLQTGHIQHLANYVPKWKSVLKPYQSNYER